ncbi:hypothetical protein [Streptomyces sp. CB00455]|uniref:hypothetical protein n=1 Tax=Streptomyces sp. CB00455 TaxID=1703927 RepID=UPI001161408D|nr:hypothetical protein [Streptomyces sp. CB00455]
MTEERPRPAAAHDQVPGAGGGGCVFAMVRIPVRIAAVVIVLPLRMAWDLLVLCARAAHRRVLRPAGEAVARLLTRIHRYVLAPVAAALVLLVRGTGTLLRWLALAAFYWPWWSLWHYVLAPVGAALWRRLLVPGAAALHRYLLRPLGRGLERVVLAVARYVLVPALTGLARLLAAGWHHLVVRPARGLAWLAVAVWRHALAPLGHALGLLLRGIGAAALWTARALFLWPWAALWRYVVLPVAAGAYGFVLLPLALGLYRHVLTPLGHFLAAAWHLAGRVSRALGRGLLRLWRGLVVRPAAWVRRQVLVPAGHAVREVWRTARLAVREARASVRQALFGTPPGEPARSRTRTLGSTTGAGTSPAPEISLHQRQG